MICLCIHRQDLFRMTLTEYVAQGKLNESWLHRNRSVNNLLKIGLMSATNSNQLNHLDFINTLKTMHYAKMARHP